MEANRKTGSNAFVGGRCYYVTGLLLACEMLCRRASLEPLGLTVHVQDWPTISRTTTRVAVGSMNDRGKSKCDIVTANNIFLLSFVEYMLLLKYVQLRQCAHTCYPYSFFLF